MESNTNTLPQAVERPALRSGDLFDLLRTMLNKHHSMAADDYREGVSDRVVKKHYDEYMAAEDAFTAQLRNVVDALKEIDREASGALNNAFPEDAPDVLANVAGIARRALGSNGRDEPRGQNTNKLTP
jgi:hypothetical protein